MAKGTKDLRQASLVLLDNIKERKEQCENRIASARASNDVTKENQIQEWIIVSWELEKQLLQNSIDTIEKWIVEDNYDW